MHPETEPFVILKRFVQIGVYVYVLVCVVVVVGSPFSRFTEFSHLIAIKSDERKQLQGMV